jgi:dihydroflavonol-4-reductase
MEEADVVFDTTHGVIYRRDRALARFVFGELIGPGDVAGTTVGDWLLTYVKEGSASSRAGGACITDARDVALAMIAAAERGVSGEIDVVGPFYTFDELAETVRGTGPSRTQIALPELGITFRPVEETIADVISYLAGRGERTVRSMVA